jgi:hypothetical protein
MAWGFVYVLGNDCMPGIYKIGRTDRAPRERAEELSKSTGVPMPFFLVMYGQASDPVEAERAIHADLKWARVSDDREFFRLGIEKIQDALRECDEVRDICFVQYKWLLSCEKFDEREQFSIQHYLGQTHDFEPWHQGRGFE